MCGQQDRSIPPINWFTKCARDRIRSRFCDGISGDRLKGGTGIALSEGSVEICHIIIVLDGSEGPLVVIGSDIERYDVLFARSGCVKRSTLD
jgi:hypothetical protein